ncbi:MAG TPA: twin-arginine translocation signal domain-containing protein [Dongiaceae bacterium]|nr:twin-arginine translocation signal domain-containing protein [Dongiaceae bacterium]
MILDIGGPAFRERRSSRRPFLQNVTAATLSLAAIALATDAVAEQKVVKP